MRESLQLLESGGDVSTLVQMLERLSTSLEGYQSERDEELALTDEMAVDVASVVAVLGDARAALPWLPARAVKDLTAIIKDLEPVLQHIIQYRSDSALRGLIRAYRHVFEPFTVLATVETHIRQAIDSAHEQLVRSADGLADEIQAAAVQSKRIASDERRRLDDEVDRLRKSLLTELTASGESVVTAAKADVSEQVLQNAQKEFEVARTQASRDVTLWAGISVAIISGFLILGWQLLGSQEVLFVQHPGWTWQFVYIAGLRLAVLTAVGALASFSLRMLKQHIQIRHAVAYKCRILRSVPGLLVASTADHRYKTLQVVLPALLSDRELLASDGNAESLTVKGPKLPSHGREDGAV